MSISLQFKLTQAGQSAAFNATNTGLSLNLTHVEVGSGNKTPTGLETALVTPVASVGIAAGFSVSPSQIRMTAVFSGAASFAVREVGLWSGVPGAAGSVLVCYWSQASGDLVVKASGVDFVFSHDMVIDSAVASGSLTVVADPAQAAVLAMVAMHEQSPDPHKQYTTSVEVQSLIESRLSAAIYATGPANAYVVALSPAITSYTSAVAFSWTTGVENTGAATLNAGGGVKQLRMPGGAQLAAGDIAAGSIVSVVYDAVLDAFVVLQRHRVASQVALSGRQILYPLQTASFTITNFNSFSSYAVTASAGTVSRFGDAITYTAPASPGAVTITVTMDGALNIFPLTVVQSVVATPAITSPAAGATGVFVPITFTSSAFAVLGTADTHLNSDWQLSANPNFTPILQSNLGSTASLTTWTVTGLTTNTTYYVRVLHRGVNNGTSAWSSVVSFTTNSTFNSYIPTPVATPAIGAPLEGGFYTGMIWNELVQSSTSTGIGTGSKVFTVPNMVGAPIVYAGQTLEVRSRANPANKMVGTVTAAVGTALTINVTSTGGSGTFSDWSVMAQYRIIVSPKSSGEAALLSYSGSQLSVPLAACQTLTEGRRATLAMVAAGTSDTYPAAHFCNSLNIGGRTDWYLPARDELELCWRNLKPTTDSNYVGTNRPNYIDFKNLGAFGDASASHGANLNSSPVGAAYTASVPGRTDILAFRTGGTEAFVYDAYFYWSSTEISTFFAFAQYPIASQPRQQDEHFKTSSGMVRAVRRSII